MSQKVFGAIKKHISEVSVTLERLPLENIAQIVELLEEAHLKAKPVFIFGSGGLAATVSYFTADLCKGAISKGKMRIKASALTNNVPLLTALANDTVYENIFAEPLENLVELGDITIGVNGSRNSPNALNGIKVARTKEANNINFTGFYDGKLKDLVHLRIIVPSHIHGTSREYSLAFEHVITTCLRGGP